MTTSRIGRRGRGTGDNVGSGNQASVAARLPGDVGGNFEEPFARSGIPFVRGEGQIIGVIRSVKEISESDLLFVAQTFDRAGFGLCLRQGGKKQRRENRDDRDHNEEFDESESSPGQESTAAVGIDCHLSWVWDLTGSDCGDVKGATAVTCHACPR